MQNEFLASVSHELRTPLTSIRMFIDTLREGRVTDSAETQRCLAVINRELGRLDGLVGKLIELSKIESAATPSSGVRSPWPPLEEALAMFRTHAISPPTSRSTFRSRRASSCAATAGRWFRRSATC